MKLPEIEIKSKDVEKYMDNAVVNEGDTGIVVNNLLELAVDILNRVGVSKDVDFVKKEVQGMVSRMSDNIRMFENTMVETVERLLIKSGEALNIDVEGSIMNKSKSWLRDELVKIKTGAVESSKIIIEAAQKASKEDISSIEKGIKDTADNFNPDLETSYLAKLKAVIVTTESSIRILLNPANTGGFAYQLNTKIMEYFGANSPVLHSVQTLLNNQQNIFTEELTKLREEIAQRVGIDETMEKTAIKGFAFEDEVEKFLNEFATNTSDIATRVSLDSSRGKKGDFIYEFEGFDERVVIECKDESIGLKPIFKYLDEAMENRECKFSIVVTKKDEQLPNASNGFNFYLGDKLFCSMNTLGIALRFYKIYFAVKAKKVDAGEVDRAIIKDTIEGIRNELRNIQNVKTKLTGIDKYVSGEAEKIKTIVDNMQSGIFIFLSTIETEISK